jgi:hypothetical protein
MSSIIGNIRDFFSDINSRASTIQYSKLHNLTIGGIPLFTYGLIGITTVVLASVTILDSGEQDEEENEEDESMLNNLPTVEGIKETLSNISPFSSSEESPQEEESKEESITGGKKSNKKNRTHSNKKKNKKSKTYKSKK